MSGRILFLFIVLAFAAPFTSAQSEEAGEAAESEQKADADMQGEAEGEEIVANPRPAIYLPLKPAFVVNYGGKGRLRYLKTELSVRLESSEVANAVRHHMPLIRNNLVMLFARQTEELINSQDGRELLRKDALEEIRKVVLEEDGLEGVIEVFFNSFIVQN